MPKGVCAKGLVLRLSVTGQEEPSVSRSSHSIHPKDHFGFGIRQSKIMHQLYMRGTPTETIAEVYGLEKAVVDETIAVESGVFDARHPRRFGWDEAMHVLISNPGETRMCLEMCEPFNHDRWHPLEHCEGTLEQVVAAMAGLKKGPGGGRQCRVRGGPLDGAAVGASVQLTPAEPQTAGAAVRAFDLLGRLGGDATRLGAAMKQELERQVSPRSEPMVPLAQPPRAPAPSASAPKAVEGALSLAQAHWHWARDCVVRRTKRHAG
ncbi:unnamed protein product [Prorocentrum cordatum]|uniref:Uncharacterized protein n=1 Tax=Prorocentrum cordatum TaxID=2364126 RepID=A0ABN9SU53_9DINO|nr:unnamed protein product [Polarella glacialis]